MARNKPRAAEDGLLDFVRGYPCGRGGGPLEFTEARKGGGFECDYDPWSRQGSEDGKAVFLFTPKHGLLSTITGDTAKTRFAFLRLLKFADFVLDEEIAASINAELKAADAATMSPEEWRAEEARRAALLPSADLTRSCIVAYQHQLLAEMNGKRQKEAARQNPPPPPLPQQSARRGPDEAVYFYEQGAVYYALAKPGKDGPSKKPLLGEKDWQLRANCIGRDDGPKHKLAGLGPRGVDLVVHLAKQQQLGEMPGPSGTQVLHVNRSRTAAALFNAINGGQLEPPPELRDRNLALDATFQHAIFEALARAAGRLYSSRTEDGGFLFTFAALVKAQGIIQLSQRVGIFEHPAGWIDLRTGMAGVVAYARHGWSDSAPAIAPPLAPPDFVTHAMTATPSSRVRPGRLDGDEEVYELPLIPPDYLRPAKKE